MCTLASYQGESVCIKRRGIEIVDHFWARSLRVQTWVGKYSLTNSSGEMVGFKRTSLVCWQMLCVFLNLYSLLFDLMQLSPQLLQVVVWSDAVGCMIWCSYQHMQSEKLNSMVEVRKPFFLNANPAILLIAKLT